MHQLHKIVLSKKVNDRMKIISLMLLLMTALPAQAEIEKNARSCETGLCFFWWPKLPTIEGWHKDGESSLYYGANTQVPNGFTFADAETVITASALFKPRMPDVASLAALIKSDHATFLAGDKGMKIQEVSAIKTKTGQALKSYRFTPSTAVNWEQVSYGEEGEFYLIFTVSSHSKKRT